MLELQEGRSLRKTNSTRRFFKPLAMPVFCHGFFMKKDFCCHQSIALLPSHNLVRQRRCSGQADFFWWPTNIRLVRVKNLSENIRTIVATHDIGVVVRSDETILVMGLMTLIDNHGNDKVVEVTCHQRESPEDK